MGKADQRIGAPRPPRGKDRRAHAVIADLPAVVAEAVTVGRNAAHHRPEEAQPRLVECAEAGEAHDRFRRPQAEAAPRSVVPGRA